MISRSARFRSNLDKTLLAARYYCFAAGTIQALVAPDKQSKHQPLHVRDDHRLQGRGQSRIGARGTIMEVTMIVRRLVLPCCSLPRPWPTPG